MRRGRPKVALILTDEERRRLDSLAHRSRSAPHVARRARIILACADGTDSKVVARRLHVTPATVCKWRGRFVTDRLNGLYGAARAARLSGDSAAARGYYGKLLEICRKADGAREQIAEAREFLEKKETSGSR